MPQPIGAAVMTLQGQELLAKSTAGECKIKYMYMAIGNGDYSEQEKTKASLKTRTALKSEKNRYSFSDLFVENKNLVKLKALLSNYDPIKKEALVTAAYYINEIGIYAKEEGKADDTAVLVSIATTASDNGDFMPPYNGQNPTTITQGYYITVSDEADVTVNVKGAALLAEDANKITDDTTKKRYKLGIDNGAMYYVEVKE